MALPQRTRLALAGGLLALASFGLGLLASGRSGGPPPPAPPTPSLPAPPPSGPEDAGAAPPPGAPRIALDPARVELLPDASLRLELPSGFGGGGGGSAEGSGAR